MRAPFANAARIANPMLVIDAALTVGLMKASGLSGVVSLALALLAPAWSALVLALLLTWVKPIRPKIPPEFPGYATYPLVSSALVYAIAVLTCGKSPSIVAMEPGTEALALWTHYPFAVVSAIAKIVAMTAWAAVGQRHGGGAGK